MSPVRIILLAFALANVSAGTPAPSPALPGFGQTCTILLSLAYGEDVELVERMIGLDPATRREVKRIQYADRVLHYERNDGLIAEIGVRFHPASAALPRDRYTYNQDQAIRMRNKVWVRWTSPDFKRLEYLGLAAGAPKNSLCTD